MNDDLRFRLEQNAVALLLAFSGACFAVGIVLQHGSRAVDRALTWGTR